MADNEKAAVPEVVDAYVGAEKNGGVASGWLSGEDRANLQNALVVLSFQRTSGAILVFMHPPGMQADHADAIIGDMLLNPKSPLADAKGSYVCQLILSGDHVLLRYDPI